MALVSAVHPELTTKLQLGAFDQAIAGWVNTDVTPHIFISRIPLAAEFLYRVRAMPPTRYRQHKDGIFRSLRYMDLTKPLPLATGSCSAVFSSHVLEHLFLDEVRRLLKEIVRILRPGAICRAVVPDLRKIVATFDEKDPEPFLMAMFEIGGRSAVKNSHHSGFTEAFLVKLFQEAGFSEAYPCAFRQGRCPDLYKLDNRSEESIYVEGIR